MRKCFTYASVSHTDFADGIWYTLIFAKNIKQAVRKAKRQCRKYKETLISVEESNGVENE